MKSFYFLCLLPFALLITNCATMSAEKCQSINWREAGLTDGSKGEYRDFYKTHQASCSAEFFNHDLYMLGWEEGHKSYCTAENGYKAGVSKRISADICSQEQFPLYHEQFKIGRGVNQLLQQRQEVQNQIEKSQEDRSVIANVSRGLAVWNGMSPTESLDKKKEEIDEKISVIENNAPGGPTQYTMTPQMLLSDPDLVSSIRDFGGATIGMMFGFGSGHAIQGRYATSGWKWTLGEVATFSGLIAASNTACQTSELNWVTNPSGITKLERQCTGDQTWILPSVAVWLGVRIWQTVDLFSYSSQSSNERHYKSAVIAHPQGVVWLAEF